MKGSGFRVQSSGFLVSSFWFLGLVVVLGFSLVFCGSDFVQ